MSEIITHNVRHFKSIVNSLDMNEEGEILSPHKCLMIKYIGNNTISFTSYSPRRVSFTYYLQGEDEGGEKDTAYLADHPGLKTEIENFDSAQRSQLSFSDYKGRLIIKANERVENGVTDYDAVSYVNLYSGPLEDFAPPENLLEEQLVGSIYKEHLIQILRAMESFGGNEYDSTIYLRCEGGHLVSLTNFGLSSSGYVFVARPMEINNEEVVATALSRKYIPKIRFLIERAVAMEKVNIYYDYEKNWLEFSCSAGNFLVKGEESNQQIINAMLISGSEDQDLYASRNVDARELIQGLQQFKKSKTSKLLVWASNEGQDPVLRLNELDLLSDSKFCKVNTEYEQDLDTWLTIAIDGPMAKHMVSTLEKVVNLIEKDRDTDINSSTKGIVNIQQYKTQKNPKITLLYIFYDKDTYKEISFGLMYSQDAADQLDQIDSDD